MNMPAKADVDEKTSDLLTGLALSDPELLLEGIEARADWQRKSGLDPRSFSLVKLAALVALDAPPSSYLWQVGNALRVLPLRLGGQLLARPGRIGCGVLVSDVCHRMLLTATEARAGPAGVPPVGAGQVLPPVAEVAQVDKSPGGPRGRAMNELEERSLSPMAGDDTPPVRAEHRQQ